MKSIKIMVLIVVSLIVMSGCVATKNIKPLRYDGVYKQFRALDVVYLKFEKNSNKWNSVTYPTENDMKAIQELDRLSKNKVKKEDKFYRNDATEVRTYGGNSKMSWHGGYDKNKNGELKNSFFIKTENGRIKETIDLRLLDSFKIYSLNGTLLSKDVFEEVGAINNRYIVVRKNSKYGILDVQTRSLKVPTIYQWIDISQSGNERIAFKFKNKYGFFDPLFNIAIPAQYDDMKSIQFVGYFIDGIQPVKLNNRWIIIDKYNNRLIDTTFDNVGEYASRDFVPVYNKEKKLYEFLNLNTKKFTGIFTYNNKMIYDYNILDVGKGKALIFDSHGKPIFKHAFYNIFPYTNKNDKTYFKISLDNSFSPAKAIIDKNMNFLVPAKYKDIKLLYSKNGEIKYFQSKIDFYHNALYNTNGDLILPAKFENISIFDEDRKYILAKISKNNSVRGPSEYYIFKEGTTKPLFSADYIWKINKHGKYAMFRKNGFEGIIDMNLKVVVEAKHVNIIDIKNGFYATYLDGESTVYKISDGRKLLEEVDGRVDLKDKYITVANRQEDSIYNYEFKKLNSKDLVLIESCSKDNNSIIFQDENKKWGLVYKQQIKYFNEDFINVKCRFENFVIAKLKNKSMQ